MTGRLEQTYKPQKVIEETESLSAIVNYFDVHDKNAKPPIELPSEVFKRNPDLEVAAGADLQTPEFNIEEGSEPQLKDPANTSTINVFNMQGVSVKSSSSDEKQMVLNKLQNYEKSLDEEIANNHNKIKKLLRLKQQQAKKDYEHHEKAQILAQIDVYIKNNMFIMKKTATEIET